MTGRNDGTRRTSTAAGEHRAWARELLEHLRPGGRDVRRVVDWLAGAVHAEVSLRDAAGTLLAGTRVPLDESLLAGLGSGRIASAAYEGAGHHVRLVKIGHGAQVCVLAVSRKARFDRDTSDVVTHTAQVIELLLTARETTVAGHRLRRATADLRLAILQLLMVEDTVAARRVAAGLWPGLLDADTACVYVIESEPARRERLLEECLDTTREEALVVRCPAMDGHVIVVSPREATADALRSLVERHPRTFLGGSVRQSLARTATAYGQAVSALAVARFRADKTAVYAERTHPERLMDPAALRGWTALVLRPLDALPHHTRAELLATTRLGLEFTAVNAAKILGVSRNTVRARMDRVETMLGVDFGDVTARAVVHLALHTQINVLDGRAGTAPGAHAPRLADLLAGPAVGAWAQELLGRLDRDSRNVRRTVRTWIAAGGNAERAARGLGVHPQTVREHVRSAEPVLERRLLTPGTDLYEVVLAHLAVGDLRQPLLAGE
ncbi:helix-turn-helix domain-containing protein [Streptomyces griseoloalbus]|uniref:DNA-directed RNA polymerase specialized sigma24 family protein n=1 Tax=Streptomyces griseoloalbus TaxID=67303 RepID=A0A7W8BUT2_9ACTN|nr:helix-turn-helix domain-containing protein [Streptomyces albaduncus]MBB5130026.1 DNA-directed RNA polymerase specialized sigma24 family protein [Streptomyces albaduncus]GGW47746.1 DNA-binding protein [Streptomyces albaduncus]